MLHRSLYRSLLKEVNKAFHHYAKDYPKTSRAIFGTSIDPSYWLQFGPTPRHAVRHYFRHGFPKGLASREKKSVAVFDALKRLSAAVGKAEEDAKLLTTVTLRRGSVSFVVQSYNDEAPPPNRLCVNGDPFWAQQMCLPSIAYPWKDELMWRSDGMGPEKESVTTTHNIRVTCTTKELRQVNYAGNHTHTIYEYRIRIENIGKRRDPTVQVLSRHWYFLDLDQGTMVEVCGKGVAGVFPLLRPGMEHTYCSGTDLRSRNGVMRGIFQVARFTTTSSLSSSEEGGSVPPSSATTNQPSDGEAGGGAEGGESGMGTALLDVVDVHIAPTMLRP